MKGGVILLFCKKNSFDFSFIILPIRTDFGTERLVPRLTMKQSSHQTFLDFHGRSVLSVRLTQHHANLRRVASVAGR